MRLSHITIQGFKSFAKKTTIDVTHQVTGVVGPNGSGKSNIAEAIRFVLGEQSMKTMRGKSGSDVIFQGSEQLGQLSRACVTMVIDNREKRNTEHINEDLAPFLVYDELVLARTIYRDGGSEYTLNDAKVRLKDVQELLSFAGIGGSAHTIINQGEADKILLANPKDKKEAIEDALGLRVYHMRLNESARKLEKVKVHVHEVELLRQEIKPHLAHLKRQVEKIESQEEERKKLHGLLASYLRREDKELAEMRSKRDEAGTSSALLLVGEMIEKELRVLKESKSKEDTQGVLHEENKRLREKERLVAELSLATEQKDEVTKTLGKKEGEISFIQREYAREKEVSSVVIDHSELLSFHNEVDETISSLERKHKEEDRDGVTHAVEDLRGATGRFFEKHTHPTRETSHTRKEELASLEKEYREHEEKYTALQEQIASLKGQIAMMDSSLERGRESKHEEEKKIMLLESKLRELTSTIQLRKQEESELLLREEHYAALYQEGLVIIGKILSEYASFDEVAAYEQYSKQDLMRAIERSKLRIEEAGVPNKEEVLGEYKTTKERDEYLTQELSDIRASEEKLVLLIQELTETLKERFASGVKEVSLVFGEFFEEIFPEGKAKLSLVPVIKVDEDGNEYKEDGLDIDVSLPKKKIKEIGMFSGGERALVSIALLFAMSSVTPPPFMVLDETDAPLDESNARKYGFMLKRLSEKSKLLVITHNRETMNHCDMLYGVTIGGDGGSKMLSISFKDGK